MGKKITALFFMLFSVAGFCTEDFLTKFEVKDRKENLFIIDKLVCPNGFEESIELINKVFRGILSDSDFDSGLSYRAFLIEKSKKTTIVDMFVNLELSYSFEDKNISIKTKNNILESTAKVFVEEKNERNLTYISVKILDANEKNIHTQKKVYSKIEKEVMRIYLNNKKGFTNLEVALLSLMAFSKCEVDKSFPYIE